LAGLLLFVLFVLFVPLAGLSWLFGFLPLLPLSFLPLPVDDPSPALVPEPPSE